MKRNFFLFFLIGLLSIGCSEGRKTSTQFSLGLQPGFLSAGSADFTGGIILMGSNGTDRFSTGISPSEVSSFALELPSGDWRFRSVAWLGDGSNAPMTGESRCGLGQANIDGTDTVVEMKMSQSNCQTQDFSSTDARDTSSAGSAFLPLHFNSCLNPVDHATGTQSICNGTSPTTQPGESTSLRVAFPAGATFSANVKPLRSACYNLDAYSLTTPDLNQGVISTGIRFPFGATNPIPFVVTGYEDRGCVERTTRYPFPEGLTNTYTKGTHHLVYPQEFSTKITFADNYIGKVGSPFYDSGALGYHHLPKLACAPNCIGNKVFPSPGATGVNFFQNIIRGVVGRPGHVRQEDVLASQTLPTTWDLTLDSMGSLRFKILGGGNFKDFPFVVDTNTPPSLPVVSCNDSEIRLHYSYGVHTVQQIIDATQGVSCGNGSYPLSVSAFGPGATDTVDIQGVTYSPSGAGSVNYFYSGRHISDIERVRRLMFGPIGALLSFNGVTEASLCTDTGTFSYNLPNRSVQVELTNSTTIPIPEFSLLTAGDTFDKKVIVTIDGKTEEALVFSCDPNYIKTGAFISKEQKDSGVYRYQQMFWDTLDANLEWVEVAVKEGTKRDYVLFKANTGDENRVWTLSNMHGANEKFGLLFSPSTGTTYVQETTDTTLDSFTGGTSGEFMYDSTLFYGAVADNGTYVQDPVDITSPTSFASLGGFSLDEFLDDANDNFYGFFD